MRIEQKKKKNRNNRVYKRKQKKKTKKKERFSFVPSFFFHSFVVATKNGTKSLFPFVYLLLIFSRLSVQSTKLKINIRQQYFV